MSELRQREEPIRSQALLDSARGQPCTLNFEVCNNDPETTVSCHVNGDVHGGARKDDDTSTVHGCSACHMYMDQGGWIGKISQTVLLRHIVRALLRTNRNRWQRGFFGKHPTPARRTPEAKPRKPKAGRKIAGRTEIQSASRLPAKGEGRKLQSRKMERAQ
jgi:hypothetical protein